MVNGHIGQQGAPIKTDHGSGMIQARDIILFMLNPLSEQVVWMIWVSQRGDCPIGQMKKRWMKSESQKWSQNQKSQRKRWSLYHNCWIGGSQVDDMYWGLGVGGNWQQWGGERMVYGGH